MIAFFVLHILITFVKISWEKKQLCDIRFPADRCYPGRYKSFEKFAFMHPRERGKDNLGWVALVVQLWKITLEFRGGKTFF